LNWGQFNRERGVERRGGRRRNNEEVRMKN
jgi:hypothetical protein